jgi:coenzyme F420-reducing hydrogenase gamma subunit
MADRKGNPKKGERPTVAFFDFACCEGCQLSVLQVQDILQLLAQVEVVAWREFMSGNGKAYDIAFCEGSITREADVERIKEIRKTARTLVSLGACASIGCHNALKNRWPMEESLRLVYGEKGHLFETQPARPITEVVKVDYQIQGCPASPPEISLVFKYILSGKTYLPPNDPVCVECKLKDNLCVLEKGLVCLGPVTRCGCNAICTTYGDPCLGCRGLIDEANLGAAIKALTAKGGHEIMAKVVEKRGLDREEIVNKLAIYNNRPPLTNGAKSI